MKRVIRSSDSEMLTFRVYFKDGNQKLLSGQNMYSVLSYLLFEQKYNAYDIQKIEEV